MLVEETNSLMRKEIKTRQNSSKNQPEIEELVREIEKARAKWENVSISERPPLPKIALTRKSKTLIKHANPAIQLVIVEKIPSLSHINLLQYVTAYTISEKIGRLSQHRH